MLDIQSILGKVDLGDNCWIWQFSLDRHGYGQVRLNNKLHRAHRLVYELLREKIPYGLDLDHLCRNRACVNPQHLEPVTRSINLLRGELWQSKKTHCPEGHEYDLTVKDYKGRTTRRCLRCVRNFANLRQKRYYERNKNAQNSMLSR